MTDDNVKTNVIIETDASPNNGNDLVNFILDKLNDDQVKVFAQNFYMYLKYDKEKDFVIDFDEVWKWLGYAAKKDCKAVLVKYFYNEKDYSLSAQPRENPNGGRPSEQIMLSVRTFKKLCLKANTMKADEIHDYYIKLEELNMEYITLQYHNQRKQQEEQFEYAKIQYHNQRKQLEEQFEQEKMLIINKAEQEKTIAIAQEKENQILEKYKDVNCLYFLYNAILCICKYGYTNDLCGRTRTHKSGDFSDNFYLVYVIVTDYNRELESIVSIKYKHKYTTYNNQTEIINCNDAELQEVCKIIEKENKRIIAYKNNDNIEIEKLKLNIELAKTSPEYIRLQIELAKTQTELAKTSPEYIRLQIELETLVKQEVSCVNNIQQEVIQTIKQEESCVKVVQDDKQEVIQDSTKNDINQEARFRDYDKWIDENLKLSNSIHEYIPSVHDIAIAYFGSDYDFKYRTELKKYIETKFNIKCKDVTRNKNKLLRFKELRFCDKIKQQNINYQDNNVHIIKWIDENLTFSDERTVDKISDASPNTRYNFKYNLSAIEIQVAYYGTDAISSQKKQALRIPIEQKFGIKGIRNRYKGRCPVLFRGLKFIDTT